MGSDQGRCFDFGHFAAIVISVEGLLFDLGNADELDWGILCWVLVEEGADSPDVDVVLLEVPAPFLIDFVLYAEDVAPVGVDLRDLREVIVGLGVGCRKRLALYLLLLTLALGLAWLVALPGLAVLVLELDSHHGGRGHLAHQLQILVIGLLQRTAHGVGGLVLGELQAVGGGVGVVGGVPEEVVGEIVSLLLDS